MTKIKLCGMRRTEDIAMVNRHQPDYIGFIFVPGRRRTISFEQAAALKKQLDPQIKAVGVFVNAPQETIRQCVLDNIIDAVQLHGNEDDAYIINLKKMIAVPVIKAFSIRDAADIECANASAADMVLLDCGHGGTGESFDWSLLTKVTRPYFLAGGIGPDNIDDALTHNPYAIDISSGTETDGVKDEAKIAFCVSAVRRHQI